MTQNGKPKIICDFCSGDPVVAAYSAEDFIVERIDDIIIGSDGDWAACIECETLIDRKRWDALIDRVVATFVDAYPVMRQVNPSILREYFGHLYSKLLTHKFRKRVL